MNKRIIPVVAFLLLGLLSVASAQDASRKRVEAFYEALKEKRPDLALRAFGLKSTLNESQKAILKEYGVVDVSPVGHCEERLGELGKALASYDKLRGGYPESLKALVPYSMPKLPRCPTAPQADYRYNQKDRVFYVLSCPTGHGRTRGFPMYSSVDGLIPNPNFSLVNCFSVSNAGERDGLTVVKVVGSGPKGKFERDFLFTPMGGFVSGAFSNEVEEMLRTSISGKVARATRMDPGSLILGMAALSDQSLVKAAHCRLQVEKLYYKILGVRNRLGEKSFDEVAKYLDEVPVCPVSKKKLRVDKSPEGKYRVYCPGASHTEAGLGENQPSREF